MLKGTHLAGHELLLSPLRYGLAMQMYTVRQWMIIARCETLLSTVTPASTLIIANATWWAISDHPCTMSGRVLPYSKVVGNVCNIDSRFLHLQITYCPYFIPNWILVNPSFCGLNRFVSFTFSSRDNWTTYSWSNIWPKSVIWQFDLNSDDLLFILLRSVWPFIITKP